MVSRSFMGLLIKMVFLNLLMNDFTMITLSQRFMLSRELGCSLEVSTVVMISLFTRGFDYREDQAFRQRLYLHEDQPFTIDRLSLEVFGFTWIRLSRMIDFTIVLRFREDYAFTNDRLLLVTYTCIFALFDRLFILNNSFFKKKKQIQFNYKRPTTQSYKASINQYYCSKLSGE